MPQFGPVRRSKLIQNLRELGFDGPYSGGNHQYSPILTNIWSKVSVSFSFRILIKGILAGVISEAFAAGRH